MTGTKQHDFTVVRFIILYKMVVVACSELVLTSEDLNERLWGVFSCGAVYYAYRRDSVNEIVRCNTIPVVLVIIDMQFKVA